MPQPLARRCWRPLWTVLPLVLLVACAGTPPAVAPGPATARPAAEPFDARSDGAPANPPPGLLDAPDAQPRVEPIRSGGPNKPYVVLGQQYSPLAADEPMLETGLASWYGRKFHGRPTASGEIYDMYAMSAAHRTMPIPSYARVRNPANGREVIVRVNDRGPFHSARVIDLSYTAALKLGVLGGVAPVQVQRFTHEQIRSGSWRGETAVALAAMPSAAPAPVALEPAPMAPSGDAPRIDAGSPVPAVGQAATERTPSAGVAGFWVQLGAFRQRQGAFDLRQQMMRELAWLEPWLAIFDESAWFRVQAGPYASRAEAQGVAERVRAAAAVQPTVLQRR